MCCVVEYVPVETLKTHFFPEDFLKLNRKDCTFMLNRHIYISINLIFYLQELDDTM